MSLQVNAVADPPKAIREPGAPRVETRSSPWPSAIVLRSAVEARKLQEESLAAEQAKFEVGHPPAFFVIQYESLLAQARSTEVAAMSFVCEGASRAESGPPGPSWTTTRSRWTPPSVAGCNSSTEASASGRPAMPAAEFTRGRASKCNLPRSHQICGPEYSSGAAPPLLVRRVSLNYNHYTMLKFTVCLLLGGVGFRPEEPITLESMNQEAAAGCLWDRPGAGAPTWGPDARPSSSGRAVASPSTTRHQEYQHLVAVRCHG